MGEFPIAYAGGSARPKVVSKAKTTGMIPATNLLQRNAKCCLSWLPFDRLFPNLNGSKQELLPPSEFELRKSLAPLREPEANISRLDVNTS